MKSSLMDEQFKRTLLDHGPATYHIIRYPAIQTVSYTGLPFVDRRVAGREFPGFRGRRGHERREDSESCSCGE
jgi:hypothetical protein